MRPMQATLRYYLILTTLVIGFAAINQIVINSRGRRPG